MGHSPDHPHRRGDNDVPNFLGILVAPDHPHRRGDNGGCRGGVSLVLRTTPTDVGTTPDTLDWDNLQSDHPHRRGDNAESNLDRIINRRTTPTDVGTTHCSTGEGPYKHGPPPQTWGQRLESNTLQSPHRGPPPQTWGQRAIAQQMPISAMDHPHRRGDNPRTRRGLEGHIRTTPTDVGTTGRCGCEKCSARAPPPQTWGQRLK